jgi:hypothetical protein
VWHRTATFERKSQPSRRSPRQAWPASSSPSSVAERESLIRIARLPPTEFARAFAQLLASHNATIRPEDARWIEDVEYISTVRQKDLDRLTDDELLELIKAQVRVANRSTAHERELEAILNAQKVIRSQRSAGSPESEGRSKRTASG